MSDDARQPLRDARRVVVKVGTSVVTRSDGRLALGRLGSLVEQVHELRRAGREVLLVTSGAIGLGAGRLGMTEVPTAKVDRQAAAAAGQGALMALYDTLLRQCGEIGAQVLLTEGDFLNRRRYLNLHATLERLLELGAVPVINENDTVSTAELALHGRVFGDNDRLGALVAAGIEADLLVLLSDVDGVYTGPPSDPESVRLPTWEPESEVAFGEGSKWGRGGMRAKIAAALVAVRSGSHVVIGSGYEGDTVRRVLAGEPVGTLFPARRTYNKRRHWLAFATAPTASVVINDGARAALVDRNASLLAAGVVRIDGEFDAGDVVSVRTEDGAELARGVPAISAAEARRQLSAARERGKPLLHRDHVVILNVEGP